MYFKNIMFREKLVIYYSVESESTIFFGDVDPYHLDADPDPGLAT